MAETIGEAIRLLRRLGTLDIASMDMESNEVVESKVAHNFKETIIVPYIALKNNISFLLAKGDRYITFADGIRCKVVSVEEKHICDLEEEIQKNYNGINVWSFIKRWYKVFPQMDSMHMVIIKVTKE